MVDGMLPSADVLFVLFLKGEGVDQAWWQMC